MSEQRPHPDDERALDPNESWGQGPDASHPNPAAPGDRPLEQGVDPTLGTDDTSLGVDDADEVDEPPLT